ncbi:MAG: DSD1 family PLP-dependent enzyme [Candidatus Firestonebacteria bacterium]
MRELITPALVVDYGLLMANIKKMALYGKRNNIGIRPHFKSHKCVEIARLQMRFGAVGITAQTIDEAEALVNGGIKKVLLANELTDEGKIKRLLRLAKYPIEVILAVENEKNLKDLNRLAGKYRVELNVLVEVDVGMDRCGREPGKDTLEFTRSVLKCSNLKFKGLQGYEGQAVLLADRKKRTAVAGLALDGLVKTKILLLENGIDCKIVTAGGTGTYNLTGRNANVTDIQPGSYVFMDSKYGSVTGDFKKALYVLSTVLCRRANGDYIGDAGHKALTSEFGQPVLKDVKGTVLKLNEEHCRIKIIGAGKKKISTIKLVPSHCCTTVNLYDNIYVVRKNKVLDVWKVNRGRKV